MPVMEATKADEIKELEARIEAYVPQSSIEEIVRLAGRGQTLLSWSSNLLSASVDRYTFTTKLIDGDQIPFDDWLSQKAAVTSPFIEVDSEELSGALSRLETVANDKRILVAEWKYSPTELRLSLVGSGEGVEVVSCEADEVKAGFFGVPLSQIKEALGAITSESVRFAPAGSNKPFRIINPTDPDLIVVQQPCHPGHEVTARNA